MVLNTILAALAFLSLALMLWQWIVARRFPLHRRVRSQEYAPGVTLLKPLKGCDQTTETCLRSWLAQDYAGPMQFIFAVASPDDPVCLIVNKLLTDFPKLQTRLLIGGPLLGTNLKVSKLVQAEKLAANEILVISDADVKVSPDFLTNVIAPLEDSRVGLVNCFYTLANPSSLAMRWEAIAIDSDFWSQVLQSQSLRPLDFALGAVMATRRPHLDEIGGFAALADCLADDYQLGHRIARRGHQIVISPIVVECWSEPMSWASVWKHQLRWARTIRVCQPAPYFFSILSNATIWPLLWLLARPTTTVLVFAFGCWLVRIVSALDLQSRLTRKPTGLPYGWLVPVKDLLQTAIWGLAFVGNTIEWRGEKMRLRRDGTLVRS